jgi:hypothetical protein
VITLEKSYPNPCDRTLTFEFAGFSEVAVFVKIFNLTGNQVLQESLGAILPDQPVDLNVSALPEGTYLFVTTRNEEIIGRGQFRISR